MRILVGTPIPEAEVKALYAFAMVRLIQQFHARRPEVVFDLNITHGTLLAMARNQLVSKALADPSYSHVLFVDSDIGFDYRVVERLLDCGKDFVGCLYPTRQLTNPPRITAADALAKDARGAVQLVGGLAPTRHLGMGLTLIRRSVIERLAEAYPDLLADSPPGSFYAERGLRRVLQVFDNLRDPHTTLFVGEDVSFCRRWTDTGGEIWAMVDELVTHVGYHNFTGRLVDPVSPS
jgi:hypothetical protein